MVTIEKDGSDGPAYDIAGDAVDVGRVEGDILLVGDPYLSPRHARIVRTGESYLLRDLASRNGVYVRIRSPIELVDGDMILIGQQVLRFEILPEGEVSLGAAIDSGVRVFGTPEESRVARLRQYTTEGIGRDVYYLHREETVLGRENGDVVFTSDPFMSRRHAAIQHDRLKKTFSVRDLGSSNGTAVRIRGEWPLAQGDLFRVGGHLFRFEAPGGPRAQ